MGGHRFAVACVVASLIAATDARAQSSSDPQDELSASYLWDGGAVPFLWVPLAGRILLDTYTEPRETPLVFPETEGGAEPSGWQVPGYAISALGGVSAVGMIASGDSSRFFHVKGIAESLSTGVLLTGLIKVSIGRHRPDWDPERNTDSSRRSFPSGHATQAFAVASYTILYLNSHVFDGDGVSVGEVASYSAIGLAAFAFAGERVYNDRHHLSDVAVGGLLGTATSAAFFYYQERRWKNREQSLAMQPMARPVTGGSLVGVTMVW